MSEAIGGSAASTTPGTIKWTCVGAVGARCCGSGPTAPEEENDRLTVLPRRGVVAAGTF